MAELAKDSYAGDWSELLTLFAGSVKKVSHNVKDLTRLLIENGLPAEGFIFDTALAGYLLDATAGSYDIDRLSISYFHKGQHPAQWQLDVEIQLPQAHLLQLRQHRLIQCIDGESMTEPKFLSLDWVIVVQRDRLG